MVGGIALGFSLSVINRGFDCLIDAEQLKVILEDKISEEVFWDLGVPKGRSEFLIYGNAYSAKPTRALGVFVRVRNVSKFLMVFGDRKWTDFGISEAEPFNVMPIDYEHAFGGEGLLENPLGKGFDDAQNHTLLPNIESPDSLIVSKDDISPVAGFRAYAYDSPQRQQYFINKGEFNLDSEIIPEEVLPEYFNTAPLDQRLDQFFQGDEEIEIKNMHPFIPLIKSSLPGVRLRLFSVQEDDFGKYNFAEMNVNCETLFLLPEWERGILIFRVTAAIRDLTASKVLCIYSALELLTDQPKTIEYYYNRFLKYLPENSSNTFYGDPKNPSEFIDMTNSQNEFDSCLKHDENMAISEELGVTMFFNELRNLKKFESGSDSKIIKDLISQLNVVMKQCEISEEDIKEYFLKRREDGDDPLPSEEELLESLRDIWENDSEMYEKLSKSINQIGQMRKILLQKYTLF